MREPKMIAVQTKVVHPLVNCFSGSSKETSKRLSKALVLLVFKLMLLYLAVKILRESQGLVLTVSEILKAEMILAKIEGLFIRFSSALTIEAFMKLSGVGEIEGRKRYYCLCCYK